MNRVLPVVHIEWVDSEAINRWQEVMELDHEHMTIHTVGMLIHKDADTYLIASSYDPDLDSINAAIWIPAGCVRKVRTLCRVSLKTK